MYESNSASGFISRTGCCRKSACTAVLERCPSSRRENGPMRRLLRFFLRIERLEELRA